MSNSPNRSYKTITPEDLERLAEIARYDFSDLCERQEYSRPYAGRLRLLCLCQGAASHYVHLDRGVQDFDVWGFFDEIPNHAFPCRRRGVYDFGPSRFGRNPDDGEAFEGRRVDVIGRSIKMENRVSPIKAVQRYLQEKRTSSARLLAERPVVALWPSKYFEKIVWNP